MGMARRILRMAKVQLLDRKSPQGRDIAGVTDAEHSGSLRRRVLLCIVLAEHQVQISSTQRLIIGSTRIECIRGHTIGTWESAVDFCTDVSIEPFCCARGTG